MEGRSARQRAPVSYAEKGLIGGNGTPQWLKKTSAALQEQENRGAASGKQAKASGKVKQEAVRGRNAGLQVVEIADHKKQQQKAKGSSRQTREEADEEVAVGGSAERSVPGLPGVVQKAKPAAAADRAGPSKLGSGGMHASGSSGSKRKPAAAAPREEHEAKLQERERPAGAESLQQQQQPAPKRQKSAAAAAAAAAQTPGGALTPAAPSPLVVPSPPPSSAPEALVEHFSSNFRALQAEYDRLQQQYEDLKSAKIDQEVQHLLEQHNKYVTDHGAKAAELADHWRLEAERHEALARELGGEEAVARMAALEGELLGAQQGLLDAEAAALEKDKRIAELERRNAFLERHARIPVLADKCVQTEGPLVAAASAQAPSLEPSGMAMMEARAMAPEGAAGNSVYRGPQQRRAVRNAGVGSGASPSAQALDASYTLPPPTLQPARGAAAAAAATAGAPPAPLAGTGSDMQLTGSGQVVEGRLAHAAAAPMLRPGSGLTAESVQLQPAARQPQLAVLEVVPEDYAAAVPAPSRRASLAPVAAAAAAAAPRVEKQLHFPSASYSTAPVAQQQHWQQHQQAMAPPAAPASTARPASSGPLAPRELALTALTGLQATPMKRGYYQFTDPNSGFVFELGPAPDTSDSDADSEPELFFRPLALGAAAAVLPGHFRDASGISFAESMQPVFIQQLMDALRKVPRQGRR